MISLKPHEVKVKETSNNSVLKCKPPLVFLNTRSSWQTCFLSQDLHKRAGLKDPYIPKAWKQEIEHTIKNFISALLALDAMTIFFLLAEVSQIPETLFGRPEVFEPIYMSSLWLYV